MLKQVQHDGSRIIRRPGSHEAIRIFSQSPKHFVRQKIPGIALAIPGRRFQLKRVELLVLPVGFAFFGERGHAFFLVFGRERSVECATLKQNAFGQRGLV